MTIASPKENKPAFVRRDLQQQVTDTIIRQLEAGTIPWQQPWTGNDTLLGLPENFTTGNRYKGINILLLWGTAIEKDHASSDWASLKQWNSKKERIRKDEKGTMIVYYDTIEKEVEGEIEKIPFLKSSYVFNRCQLASFDPEQHKPEVNTIPLVERIDAVDYFISNTKAIVEHDGYRAYYHRVEDKIHMPHQEAFNNTPTCTATEGYYSTLLHELTHWSGAEKRANRKKGKRYGDIDYAAEELTAEFGTAFLCAEFGISVKDKGDHANYIAHWLEVLKNNKQCLLMATRQASKAIDYMHGLQPV
jgi:antirestriction protein ArdC